MLPHDEDSSKPTPAEDSLDHDYTRQSAIFITTTTEKEEETANENYFYSQNPKGNSKTSNEDQDQISFYNYPQRGSRTEAGHL